MTPENLLIVADSERDADMLYAVNMFVPDTFVYLRLRGRNYAVLSDLEIARARKELKHCSAVSLSSCLRALQQEEFDSPGFAEIVHLLMRRQRLKKITVSDRFPVGLAKRLRRLKIKVRVREGSLFPLREIKSSAEVKMISAALMMAEVGLAEGIQTLRAAKITKDGRLFHHHVPLTAEKLRAIINVAILQAGGRCSDTIVACGRQTCHPHERGHGVLRAHQPIVIDVFPRSQRTGYFGDITRTVVKGNASEALRKLYHTVLHGQEIGFKHLCHRAEAAEVHAAVQNYFKQEGYRTGKRRGQMEGFFHGLGHGLGLDLHEAPRLSANSRDQVRAGQVVTLEPGLYYPALGGVRLEDVALVTGNGPRNLTKFEKVLEV